MEHSLITLRYAPLASLTMLTAQGFPHHTVYTKVVFIELS
jgi:hypothetical protein